MAAVLAAARYSRIGFSPCLAVCARRMRVPSGSVFHLEPGTIDITIVDGGDNQISSYVVVFFIKLSIYINESYIFQSRAA